MIGAFHSARAYLTQILYRLFYVVVDYAIG